MNTKFVWTFAAFAIALLLPPYSLQASFLDDIMGNRTGYPQAYTNGVAPSGRPQTSGAVQYGSTGTYTTAPAPPPPIRQQTAAPKVAYQQPILQAQEIPQQRMSPKAATKKKANTASTVKAPANRRPPAAAAKTHKPNYRQTQQAGYYTSPYQTQYTASPNYYQGYYNNWGSSAQACPPGRA